ncbi:hypothetical protein R1flu_005701 [Riccia fluitans]|uniref:Lipocalin/cytosolic fatty-acid binding domain-containing protein n=1 Tax=Riccia fluitans TaxID=41844 RepID=A0ABD1YXW1_9MARC
MTRIRAQNLLVKFCCTLLFSLQLVLHVQGDYCSTTLARKSCPNLPTVDSIDLGTYTGKWYEIGGTANFRNLYEAGSTCPEVEYSKGEKEGEIKVENRDFLSARVGTIASVAGISGSSFSVCQSARAVCSQVSNGDSLLREGISKVWKLKSNIEDSYSSEASSISTAASKIESAANEISPKLDTLAKYVSQIQVANSVVSQTDGKADKSAVVELVKSNISLATEQVKSVDSSYKVMSEAQLDLIKVAESLFKRGFDGVGPSITLTDAATEVLAGITDVKVQIAAITAALEATKKAADFVLEDKSEVFYNVSKVLGSAVQNPKEGGKLNVSIGLSPDSNYWILAVNGESSSYNAALVYSCSEVLTGGIDETVWILSRTPELDDETMMSFINKASSLGIDQDCDAPFVKAVRTSNCPA